MRKRQVVVPGAWGLGPDSVCRTKGLGLFLKVKGHTMVRCALTLPSQHGEQLERARWVSPYRSDLQREARRAPGAGAAAGESQSPSLICISSESWFVGSSVLACTCLNNAFQLVVLWHLGVLSQLNCELPQGQRPLWTNTSAGAQHSPGHVDQLCVLQISKLCLLLHRPYNQGILSSKCILMTANTSFA